MPNTNKPLILASASPRRQQLLHQIGLEFRVQASDVDEAAADLPSEPAAFVRTLAERKAMAVAASVGAALVIGADTVVVVDGYILGKPIDDVDAMRMLLLLQGRAHEVITGVAVIDVEAGAVRRSEVTSVSTDVYVRPATEAELQAYIDTGECRDKAGAYGIQGLFATFISGINGDYFNIVGLPVYTLAQMLERMEQSSTS